MVVGNCWVHCVPLVSQVYFLNPHTHKKNNDKGKRMEVFMFSTLVNCLRPKTKVRADGRVQDYDAHYNGNPNLSLQNMRGSQLSSTCI